MLLQFWFEIEIDRVRSAAQRLGISVWRHVHPGLTRVAAETGKEGFERRDNGLEVFPAEVGPLIVMNRLIHCPLLDVRRRQQRRRERLCAYPPHAFQHHSPTTGRRLQPCRVNPSCATKPAEAVHRAHNCHRRETEALLQSGLPGAGKRIQDDDAAVRRIAPIEGRALRGPSTE
jgi:hypothetical protein